MAISRNYSLLTAFIILIHFAIFFFLGLFRHWGFITSINDLGVFDQAVSGALSYGYLLNTTQLNEQINWLSFHFHPVLYFFVPLYFLFSSPWWFILVQPLALSLSAWPIFLIGRHLYQSEQAGVIWATIFLVNPFLINAAAWDFHPITLAVPFVALGFWALLRSSSLILLLSCLFILICQEHLGVMVIGFGILWWIWTRQWIPGTVLILLGATHFYLVLQVIMPAFSPTGQHVMVSEDLGQLSRYAWLGDSIGDIIHTIFTQPFFVLETVLIGMGGLGYLVLLLLPFLFFPLLGLVFLLPGMADLAANMLSANPMPRSPIAYHSATLIPIFTIAAMYEVKKISKWQKRFTAKELSALALITTSMMAYAFAPFPLPGAKNVWAPASFIALPDSRVQEISSLVGNEASTSVQANVGAHFSQRREIYRYPNQVDRVDAVILWLESPTQNIHNYPEDDVESRRYIIGMLDSHLQMDRKDYLASVEALLLDDEFGVAYWDEPWLVLKRDIEEKDIVPDVMARLEELRKKWR